MATRVQAYLTLHWPLAAVMLIAASSAFWSVPGGWLARLAIGWCAGVALFLVETAFKLYRTRSTARIRERAAALDEAGPAVLPLALLAGVASVVVVVGEAATGDPTGGPILALFTVALSWAFVHVIFAFHYAHAFYAPAEGRKGDRGGLIFPGDEAPDYWDFLHFSLIIGVASQTADIQISDKPLRRTSTVHSVTAFLFNTVVVALTVNMAISPLGGA